MRIAVSLHLFAPELLPEFVRYLSNITKAGYSYDLYVAVPRNYDHSAIKKYWPGATVFERENRGFDIASFFISLQYILKSQYDYILKLHSKTSEGWRKDLIEPILGTPSRVRQVLRLFENQSIGMVGCQKWLIPLGTDWGVNAEHGRQIAKQWQVPLTPCKFIGGTTFWTRCSIFRNAVAKIDLSSVAQSLNTVESLDAAWYLMTYPDLKKLGVVTPQEAQQHWEKEGRLQGRACNCLYARINHIGIPNCDGMLEHAYERFFGLLVTHARQEVVGMTMDNLVTTGKVTTLVLYHPQQEWSAVKGNVHGIQPHPELGYYNSYDSQTLQQQLAMMIKYGIGGVCYRLTPATLNFVATLQQNIHSLPFCIWWDSTERLDRGRLYALFQHSHYLREQGKPLLYCPTGTPAGTNPSEFALLRNTVTVPKNHALQYQGITVRNQGKFLGEELVNFYQTVGEGQQFVVLRSWNDWMNQTTLEPTSTTGYKNLQELREALRYFD